MAIADPEVLEREVPPTHGAALEQQTRGEIDVQIATAKRYPRSIKQFTDEALEMATLTGDIAASCIYALPRKEDGRSKMIEGPSARFAEICASAWGHMRVEARPVDEDERFITVRGMAWDLQRNTAIAFEVKRRITNRKAEKFGDDMVSVTSNAASSIAIRNAILKVIPAAFWKPIYQACRQAVAGDLKTLTNRRSNMFEAFQKIGVLKDQVLTLVDVKGAEDIGIEELVTLQGILTSLKDGDATIAEIFGEKDGAKNILPAQRKSQQAPEAAKTDSPAPATNTAADATKPATGAPAPQHVGVIVMIAPVGSGASITLHTGFVCVTSNTELLQAATRYRDSQAVVELATRANRNGAGKAPVLEEISVVPEATS